jgi:hypothetical protein
MTEIYDRTGGLSSGPSGVMLACLIVPRMRDQALHVAKRFRKKKPLCQHRANCAMLLARFGLT